MKKLITQKIHTCVVLEKVMAIIIIFASGTAVASAEIPEEVKIGGIFDVTGNWSQEGEEGKFIAEVAVADFNRYLESVDAHWRLVMQVEDAQALGSVAFDKVQTLKGNGINLLVGMSFSSHIQTSLSYINNNNMLAVSCCSQAVNLDIPDNVFRLRPNDNNQAPEVSDMIKAAGIEVLVTVHRGDAWGDGLKDGVVKIFEAEGGKVVDAIRYSPDLVDFSVEVSILDEQLDDLISEYGAENIGVLYIGTSEFLTIIEQLKFYENASAVRWFSTNTQAGSTELLDNPDTLAFSEKTMLTALRSVSEPNDQQKYVNDIVMERYSRNASVYTYPAYDSIWLLGMSIMEAQTTDVPVLVETIPKVAAEMKGSVGDLRLGKGGDLLGASYEIWRIEDGRWIDAADSHVSATRTLTDDTVVNLLASRAESGRPMSIDIVFVDTKQVNYDIQAMQLDQIVLDESGIFAADGKMAHTTIPLPGDEPVTVTVTFNGYGTDGIMSGPIGEKAIFANVIPEFGVLAVAVLAVAVLAVVIISGKTSLRIPS